MIRNIIFDMGQVLIRWVPAEMMADFDLTDAEKNLLITELFHGVEWIQQDRGILKPEQVTQQVCARLPEKLHAYVRILVHEWYNRFLIPMPGMGELVQELKENGYRLFLLSNASLALRDYFYRIPGAECFEGLMVSAEEVLLKPQHEIYERLYSKFHLLPEDCLFIDDSPANIEGAVLTGMQGIIFRGDADALRRELNRVGIPCKLGGTK